MAFYTVQKDKIILHVKVTPGKTANKITGVKNDELCVNIKAPPEKGKANKEIVRFLSKELNLSRADMEIKSGHTNRHKTILLPAGIQEKLENFTDKATEEE